MLIVAASADNSIDNSVANSAFWSLLKRTKITGMIADISLSNNARVYSWRVPSDIFWSKCRRSTTPRSPAIGIGMKLSQCLWIDIGPYNPPLYYFILPFSPLTSTLYPHCYHVKSHRCSWLNLIFFLMISQFSFTFLVVFPVRCNQDTSGAFSWRSQHPALPAGQTPGTPEFGRPWSRVRNPRGFPTSHGGTPKSP